MAEDPFDDLLNLEDRFYEEGYKQGTEDGIQAGRIEGRSFGLEKGFEKFLESGRLHGKAVVWANRTPCLLPRLSADKPNEERVPSRSSVQEGSDIGGLPALPKNSRLEKNITTLYALVEPETLSTENTDESVNDFDDRVKRAQGKAKIIEKMVGEDGGSHVASISPRGGTSGGDGISGATTRSPPSNDAVSF